MPLTKTDYLKGCYECAQNHKAVAIVTALIAVYSFVSSAAPLISGIPPWVMYAIKGLPRFPLPWVAMVIFCAGVFIAVEGGYMQLIRDRRAAAEAVAGLRAALAEERSSKNAPDLGLELTQSGQLMLANRSLDKDAHNISFHTITGPDYTLEAMLVPFLGRGVTMPFRVFCTKNGNNSIWDGQRFPFEPLQGTAIEITIPVSIEFADRQGSVTYVAEFHFAYHRLMETTIRQMRVTTKPPHRESLVSLKEDSDP